MDPFVVPKLTKSNLITELANVYLAPGAKVVGQVKIGKLSSIWYNATVRGDINQITIGEKTNIQDNSVVHVANDDVVEIGDSVTVGHSAILHGCTIEDGALIGMGAIVLNKAVVKRGAVIGAGAVIKEGEVVEANCLYVGVPGRKLKFLGEESYTKNLQWAEKYYQLSLIHRKP